MGCGPGRRDRARFGRELGNEELGRAGDGCQRRADGVVGVEIGAAPDDAENVFASLVGDIVRELEDDAALDGGTSRMFGVLGLVPGKRCDRGTRKFPGIIPS